MTEVVDGSVGLQTDGTCLRGDIQVVDGKGIGGSRHGCLDIDFVFEVLQCRSQAGQV